jgi:hypothetical protein
MKDYYKILGLERDATTENIKQRFKELAFENHPDVTDKKDGGEAFIEIYEAYDILNNPDSRVIYDMLYDAYNGKTRLQVHDEEKAKSEYWTITGSARENARQKAKLRYRAFIRDMDCFFITGLKGDGKPYSYNMHKNIGIAGGTGPMGSIKSRTVSIPIPRSKKALLMHRVAFIIKTIFLIAAILVFKPGFFTEKSILFKLALSTAVIVAGGFVTLIFYQVNKTRSKFFYAGSYLLVKKYRKNGYRRGFHPMISTTPAGIISWLLRIIF